MGVGVSSFNPQQQQQQHQHQHQPQQQQQHQPQHQPQQQQQQQHQQQQQQEVWGGMQCQGRSLFGTWTRTGSHVAYYPSPYRGRPTTSALTEPPKRGLKKVCVCVCVCACVCVCVHVCVLVVHRAHRGGGRYVCACAYSCVSSTLGVCEKRCVCMRVPAAVCAFGGRSKKRVARTRLLFMCTLARKHTHSTYIH